MENSRLRQAAPTSVNVTVGQRSREYLTDREVERLIDCRIFAPDEARLQINRSTPKCLPPKEPLFPVFARCATRGHAAAMLPTNAIDSRRLMASPAPRTPSGIKYHILDRIVPLVAPKLPAAQMVPEVRSSA